ncbi:general substrate transporter [Crassisporium funariophilum]|nr:general substrate transporter [Crassisporium funariophilum]
MAGGPTLTSPDAGYLHLVKRDERWYKNPRLVLLNMWICLLLITSSTSGYDGSMINGLQSVNEWEEFFGFPSGGKLGLFNAIQNIGSLCAFPFAPYMADGLGRRFTIWVGAAIMIIGTVIQTASQNFGMFIGARFLIGFGLTFGVSAAPLLITEIAYPTQRAQLTSVYNSLWWVQPFTRSSMLINRHPRINRHLGSIIAAWTTFGTFRIESSWSWRIPSALQGLPSIIQIFCIFLVPESPRWLVGKGREPEALATLAYYHANGNQNDPLVQYEFEEIKAALTFDREVAANVGWKSLFKTPGNRRRMRIIIALAFFSQWSGNGLGSYYLNKVLSAIGITNPNTQLLINGILSIFSCVVAVFAGFLCERVGRRPLFLTSCLGLLLFWTLETVCFAVYSQTGDVAAGHAVVAMMFLFSFCYNVGGAQISFFCSNDSNFKLAFSPLIVSYTVEILPYAIRAKGFTVFNFAISLSLIFNQYVNPIAFKALGWKYFLVYVFWIAFETVFCYFFVVETKNRSLEETAALFDGASAVAMLAEKAAKNAGIMKEMDEKEEGGKEKVDQAHIDY